MNDRNPLSEHPSLDKFGRELIASAEGNEASNTSSGRGRRLLAASLVGAAVAAGGGAAFALSGGTPERVLEEAVDGSGNEIAVPSLDCDAYRQWREDNPGPLGSREERRNLNGNSELPLPPADICDLD